MVLPEVTEKQKKAAIKKITEVLTDARKFLDKVETDLTSDDLTTQAVAVWLGGAFCEGYSSFVASTKKLDQKTETRHEIEKEMQAAQIL